MKQFPMHLEEQTTGPTLTVTLGRWLIAGVVGLAYTVIVGQLVIACMPKRENCVTIGSVK